MPEEAIWEYKHPDLKWKRNNRFIGFDIFIKSLNLAIEYQGIQHFKSKKFFGGIKAFDIQKKNDEEKRLACYESGIKLLEIPYTFNKTKAICSKENQGA